MKSVFIKLLFLVVCISLSSCNVTEQQIDTGELNVIIEESRTIEPSFLMEANSYDISGSGPDGESFYQTNVTTDTTTITNLLEGYWTVTVTAYNIDGEGIATGEKITYVASNSTNICAVDVTPLVGFGTLYLTMDWTNISIASPQVVATISNDNGTTELPFIISGNTASVTFSPDTGYYNLNIKLFDSGLQVWGIMESVRIIIGQTTSYDFICEQ